MARSSARSPGSTRARPLACLGLAVAWGLALWMIAAGLIMPVWLNLVGVPAPIPSVSGAWLVGHLLWGLTLGTTYHAYGSALTPRLWA